jgi:hypothetical protein
VPLLVGGLGARELAPALEDPGILVLRNIAALRTALRAEPR